MDFKFDDKGLICAIAQDAFTGEILMQAYMNKEALEMIAQKIERQELLNIFLR